MASLGTDRCLRRYRNFPNVDPLSLLKHHYFSSSGVRAELSYYLSSLGRLPLMTFTKISDFFCPLPLVTVPLTQLISTVVCISTKPPSTLGTDVINGKPLTPFSFQSLMWFAELPMRPFLGVLAFFENCRAKCSLLPSKFLGGQRSHGELIPHFRGKSWRRRR